MSFVHLKKSRESRKDCKVAVVQKDKRGRTVIVFVVVTHGNSFEFVQKLGASGVAVIEVCSFSDIVLLE